ncbi:hypothetical protein MTO96_048930 [Rhipicephalus appendiculatus]
MQDATTRNPRATSVSEEVPRPVSEEEDGPLEGPTKRKFLVYEDQLLELVKLCRTCLHPATSSLEDISTSLLELARATGYLAIAVWLSLLNHVQNKHTGHGLLYPECQHGDLEPRKWILPGTDAYDRLHAIVVSKRLLDDIKQVSPNFQTFGVESFHSIINRFAPKCYAFSHQGQLASLGGAAAFGSLSSLHLHVVRHGQRAGGFGCLHG